MDLEQVRQHFRIKPEIVEASLAGDHSLNPDVFDQKVLTAAKPAAVLLPFITRLPIVRLPN